SLTFEYCSENKILFDSLQTNNTFHFKKLSSSEFQDDPLIQKLNLEEFLICSLWIKNQAKGIIIVDNCVTKKPIEPDDIKIFNMFIEQASGAIENSQSFESTLTKAHTDSLTSLWNYGYFQYKLDEELIKANSIKLPLSVMMIDVDDFKKFNDAYGHIQGDNALKELSAIIKENCRKIDILCRYGGEEFSLILPNNNKQDANLLGERIRKSIEQKEIISYNFTVSIGISSYPEDGLNKLTIINQADKSLYQAKRNGKNQVVLT
ncbi:MAG: sensor domain-containing diguanylate cyclase, partial [Candidatus Omnitrophica bacterium]|nr:sensor domain-containing diguanylate cyclase [Candidatus Omnitrophota bacterium]